MSADYAPALWVPGPNHYNGRMGFPIRYIVIHGTGWPESLDEYIAEGPKTGGVQYMIGEDGRVVQFVRESDGSWGNGKIEPGCDPFWHDWHASNYSARTVQGQDWVNPNLTSISIEHVKRDKLNNNIITQAQKMASFALIDHLCHKYEIPRLYATDVNGGIVGHHSMEPVTRAYCPGPYPWDELWQYLYKLNVPYGWVDDGTKLAVAPPSGAVLS